MIFRIIIVLHDQGAWHSLGHLMLRLYNACTSRWGQGQRVTLDPAFACQFWNSWWMENTQQRSLWIRLRGFLRWPFRIYLRNFTTHHWQNQHYMHHVVTLVVLNAHYNKPRDHTHISVVSGVRVHTIVNANGNPASWSVYSYVNYGLFFLIFMPIILA